MIGAYRREHLSPYIVALNYFLLGEDEKGFEWLQRAYDEYDGILYNMTIDFELDRLRSEPRYLSLVSELGMVASSRPEKS